MLKIINKLLRLIKIISKFYNIKISNISKLII